MRVKSSGRLRDESEWIVAKAPRIISDEMFEATQRILDKNRKSNNRCVHHDYLLRGMLTCGLCGYPMYGISYHGKIYYRCSGKRRDRLLRKDPLGISSKVVKGPQCARKNVKAESLDKVVWDAIKSALKDSETLRRQARAYLRWEEKEDASLTEKMQNVERQLNLKRCERDNLIRLHVQSAELGIKTFDLHLERIKREEEELLKHREMLRSWFKSQEDMRKQINAIDRLVQHAQGALEKFDFAEKRELLSVLEVSVTLKADNTVDIIGMLPLGCEDVNLLTGRKRGVAQFG